MRITVIGTRGIPDIQGGVETHCEELYPRIVKLNHSVRLIRRSCYVPEGDRLKEYKGVKLTNLFTVRRRTTETLLHTFLAIFWTRFKGTDIVHIHAIGPALFIPLARLLGLKVVLTHHGPDYNRAKWGPIAKSVLKLGEKWGTSSANEIIVISEVIRKSLEERYKRFDTNLIFNGVTPAVFSERTDFIEKFGLEPRKYVLALGRFVEEKGFDLLIKAFANLNRNDIRLVIAGDADHDMPYTHQLRKLAEENNIILPGFVRGEALHQLMTHARLFVLPSFHEGLPISLLEAMSYNLPVVVSDIPANKQIALDDDVYFITGNTESLRACLERVLVSPFREVKYDMTPYDWDKIAIQTEKVYKKALTNRRKS